MNFPLRHSLARIPGERNERWPDGARVDIGVHHGHPATAGYPGHRPCAIQRQSRDEDAASRPDSEPGAAAGHDELHAPVL